MELPAIVHSATVMCDHRESSLLHISLIFHVYWSPGKPAYLFDERWGKYNDSWETNYIRWPSVVGPVEWQITSLQRILKHRNLCCLVSDHPASSVRALYDWLHCTAVRSERTYTLYTRLITLYSMQRLDNITAMHTTASLLQLFTQITLDGI